MSKTLRRPLAALVLAACSMIAGTGYAAGAHGSSAAAVAIGRQAGSLATLAPLCGACWGGG